MGKYKQDSIWRFSAAAAAALAEVAIYGKPIMSEARKTDVNQNK